MAKLRNLLLALVMFTACAGLAAGIDADVPEGACSAAAAQGDLDGASALLQRAAGHDGGRTKSALTLAAFDEGHLRQWAKNVSLPEDQFEKFSAALRRLPDVKFSNVSGTRLGTDLAELLGNLMNISLSALDESARALARHSLQGRSSIRESMAAVRSGAATLEQVQAITSHLVRDTSQDFGNVSRGIKALQVSVSVGLFLAGVPSNVSMRLLRPLASASQVFEEALEDLSAAEAEISSFNGSKAKDASASLLTSLKVDTAGFVRKVVNFGRELKMSLFHIQDHVRGSLGSTPAVFGHDLQVADGIVAALSDGARSFAEGANEGSMLIAQKAGAAGGLVTRTVFLFIGIVAATNPAFAL